MKNLFDYKDFINETKKAATSLTVFKKDVDNIISDMFLQAKKQKYEYDSDGFPISVEFEVVYNDWFCKYDDDLKSDFTEGVLKKREYEPVLSYSSKNQDGNGKDENTYTLKFKIKKIKVDKEALEKGEEKKRSEQLERDSDDQLLKKLKSKKTSDLNKEKIMDILKDRGVDFKDPFDEEDKEEMSDEEMEKAAERSAKAKEKKSKKNEAYSLNESHMNNIYLIAREALTFEDFKLEMTKQYPDIFRGSIEQQEEMDNYLGELYDNAKKDIAVQEKKEEKEEKCGCGKNKKGECECEKSKEKCGCEEGKCKCNEGLIGKIAKVLSKAEYNKTLKHCIFACDGECTKEKVKDAMKGMIFSKITKKSLDEDSILMNSLVDEIYKDCKKELDKKESFGSKEWQEKYGVSLKEEKEESCLKCLVNEALKIKKIDEMESLNDAFNKVYEENKIIENLDTIKKFKE